MVKLSGYGSVNGSWGSEIKLQIYEVVGGRRIV
jgi:hypothetical protein